MAAITDQRLVPAERRGTPHGGPHPSRLGRAESSDPDPEYRCPRGIAAKGVLTRISAADHQANEANPAAYNRALLAFLAARHPQSQGRKD